MAGAKPYLHTETHINLLNVGEATFVNGKLDVGVGWLKSMYYLMFDVFHEG